MRDVQGNTLLEPLLKAGIAPRHARRLLQEWAVHRAALVDACVAEGLTPQTARDEADRRLGTPEQLVAQAAERPELKSWGARWPIAVCALMPAISLALCQLALLLLLVGFSALAEYFGWSFSQAPAGARVAINGLCALILYCVPVIVASLWARYALERRIARLWPLVGIVLACTLGSLSNLSVSWAGAATGPTLSAGIGVSMADAAWLGRVGMRDTLTILGAGGICWIGWRQRSVSSGTVSA